MREFYKSSLSIATVYALSLLLTGCGAKAATSGQPTAAQGTNSAVSNTTNGTAMPTPTVDPAASGTQTTVGNGNIFGTSSNSSPPTSQPSSGGADNTTTTVSTTTSNATSGGAGSAAGSTTTTTANRSTSASGNATTNSAGNQTVGKAASANSTLVSQPSIAIDNAPGSVGLLFTFSIVNRPRGFELTNLAWNSPKFSIVNPVQEAIANGQSGSNLPGFSLSADEETLSFDYSAAMKGQTGVVIVSLTDGQGHSIYAQSAQITLK